MHITGSFLSFIGFAALLYTIVCLLKNSKGKILKAAIYSGVIGTIFLIAGLSLLSIPEEETILVPYGSLKRLQEFYHHLRLLYHSDFYLV